MQLKMRFRKKVQSAFDFTTDTYNYATSVGEQALEDAKTYTDNAITNLDVDVDLSAYYTKGEVDTKLETKSDVRHLMVQNMQVTNTLMDNI